jgi:hypothetical protein
MELMARRAAPALVRVTATAALALCCGTLEKLIFAEERVAAGLAGLEPLPLPLCMAPPQPALMPHASRINNKPYLFGKDIVSRIKVPERTDCLVVNAPVAWRLIATLLQDVVRGQEYRSAYDCTTHRRTCTLVMRNLLKSRRLRQVMVR